MFKKTDWNEIIDKFRKEKPFPFWDDAQDFEKRALDIISRLKLKEKARLMCRHAPGIKRLGIPPYDWWNECLHGVGRAGIATVFPQAIGLAATFDVELMSQIATIISDEARAKHHDSLRKNLYGKQYFGLTFWSPNINIFRDPRWGRGQETYGEDPFLTAEMGKAFVKGLQGYDKKYLKLVATPKHYAVHSGPESERHRFNAIVNKKDLVETYLYAFRECIVNAGAYSIMGAYNRVNGELCCASPTLLQYYLRERFGFKGFVVSDCGAIYDFHAHHKVTKNRYESAALGVKIGCDLNCGIMYRFLPGAVKRKLIDEKQIDKSLFRLFMAQLKLGMYDPPEKVPFSSIPYSCVDSDEHRKTALKAAIESMVLLKNNGILPLNKNSVKKIAVIGPNGNDKEVMWGNYNGTPAYTITVYEGIKSLCKNSVVKYTKGCEIIGSNTNGYKEAFKLAEWADLIIFAMGISNKIEGEQKRTGGDDRDNIELPKIQEDLMKKIHLQNPNKPKILVLINGSPISSEWCDKNMDAIIEAWYGGQEAGNAIAQIIFGIEHPTGKLPITIFKKTSDLPPFEDYSMKGRTYRYIENDPLYPFGFGLTYSRIEISEIFAENNSIEISPKFKLPLEIQINNPEDEEQIQVIQLNVKILENLPDLPKYSLKNFKRVKLNPGQNRISFELNESAFSYVNNEGKVLVSPGKYRIYIGPNQPDRISESRSGISAKYIDIQLEGTEIELDF